jgi:hypothetical protein
MLGSIPSPATSRPPSRTALLLAMWRLPGSGNDSEIAQARESDRLHAITQGPCLVPRGPAPTTLRWRVVRVAGSWMQRSHSFAVVGTCRSTSSMVHVASSALATKHLSRRCPTTRTSGTCLAAPSRKGCRSHRATQDATAVSGMGCQSGHGGQRRLLQRPSKDSAPSIQ